MNRPDFPDFRQLKRTKDHLCSLASLIARNTSDRDIGEFMTRFTNVDYLDPNFKQLCDMFRYGVKMSFELDKTLENLEGINDLLLCMEIDVCGSVEIIEDIKATDNLFEILMGGAAGPRKKFIQEHSKEAKYGI